MFYNSANGMPWHRLGVALDGLATAAEAIEAAGLGWRVVQEPVVTATGQTLEGKFINVRQDTGRPLGVVGSDYQILQNADAFRFMDEITMDPNGPKYETAGSLWGGRKIWLLAKMPDCIEVVPGDVVDPFILLSNDHAGTRSIIVRETPIRVVCQNTLNAALSSVGRGAKVRHTGDLSLKLDGVRDALGILRSNFEATAELYRALAKTEPTKEQVEQVLAALFPDTKTDRAKFQRGRVLALAEAGAGNDRPGVRGTAWALYNGITELEDHSNGKGSTAVDRDDRKLNSIWLGSGYERKAEALRLIAEVCLS